MSPFASRHATPLVAGLFLVSAVSGLALFFHLAPAWFHGMHEWLSLVLLAPVGLHLWKNWRPMAAYLRHPSFAVVMAAALAAAAGFAWMGAGQTGRSGRPPQFALAERVLQASPAQVAPLLGLTPAALSARLAAAGFAPADEGRPLAAMAEAAGRSPAEVLAALVAAGD